LGSEDKNGQTYLHSVLSTAWGWYGYNDARWELLDRFILKPFSDYFATLLN